ncbi:tetratricopeptide repeat protein [Ulvibacter antarcticus]|uniref:Tetratricopeptide repeat protein n=1 Tax=Ulvibacter antarcticus TaxID=442714 RepID=A0A3L9YWY9_9FLAO|nr:tetratricopeptide repeat protein [Ulvibacter antarcticus]RMA64854.1 tetratricopeptide repeat protein [Ulvibacter antarcticus]
MATYKKRGGKPRTKAEKEQNIEEGSTTAEVFNTLDEGASRTEEWVEKNQKYILGFIGVVAICVLGYLAFHEFVQKPKEIEATNEMFQAQTYFEEALTATSKDSLFTLALQGGEGKYGFLDIINNYGGTKAGNLARYYAGMSYLNTNNYKEAINYLDDFSSDDAIIGPLAKGAIGDAFVQLSQDDKALGYYEAAASMNKNEFTAPRFLLKAGLTAMKLEKPAVAIKHFTEITEKYPNAPEFAKATVNIGKAEAMQ